MLLAEKTTTDLVIDRIRASIARTDISTISARLQSILSLNEIQNLMLVRSPVLLLRGTADRLIPVECAEEITQHALDITVREIVAPHLLLQCHPAEAWFEIADFVTTQLQQQPKRVGVVDNDAHK